jgi:hypothetical protein
MSAESLRVTSPQARADPAGFPTGDSRGRLANSLDQAKAAFRARRNGLMHPVNGRQVLKIHSPEITNTTKTAAAKTFTRIR